MSQYDFFVSYKWKKYAPEARALKAIAERHGFRAWIDVEHPFQQSESGSPESDQALARHLLQAMNSCRYVLFFETYATLAMVVNGPPVRVISWQENELGMAAAGKLIVLYHGASPRTMGFGLSRRLHEYQELQDAFAMIKEAIVNPAGPYWRD
jgi:hypothetical protein